MSRSHQLNTIRVGDSDLAWSEAGFDVLDDAVIIGSTRIELCGAEGERGITAIGVSDLGAATDITDLDGIALIASHAVSSRRLEPHPNGVAEIDHLVVMTPHPDRTTSVYEAAGIEPRRVRTFEARGMTQRQTFFWLGDVIAEVAGPDTGAEPEPSAAWGLALTVDDLERTCTSLGELASESRPAVQPGRRVSTLRTRAIDISVPILLISPHVKEPPRDNG